MRENFFIAVRVEVSPATKDKAQVVTRRVINVTHIESIGDTSEGSIIRTSSGEVIKTLDSEKTIVNKASGYGVIKVLEG